MTLLNPYQAPLAEIGNHDVQGAPVVRRSRWTLLRWILVVYFGMFAVICPFGAIGMTGRLVFLIWRFPDQNLLASSHTRDGLLLILGYSVMSVPSFLATRSWYRCQWRRAIVMSVVFFASIGLGSLFSKLVLKC